MTPWIQLTDTVRVGPGAPCFIVAEAGVNHNGDLQTGLRLVEEAARAGAHAVKFQTFKADRLTTADAPAAEYQRRTAPTQRALLRELELPAHDHGELRDRSRRAGILFLSTPFDEESGDFLDRLGVPAFKIASGDLTHLPLLEHLARKGKPLILSTGMSTLEEVGAAVERIRASGNPPLVLMHCVSQYPTPAADANLRAIETLRTAFGVPVGFSDHTAGLSVSLAAVALGACVIEKHLTLDPAQSGPDHRSSLGPASFAALVKEIHTVETALGHGRKEPAPSELGMREAIRRSLVAAGDLAAGTLLQAEHIRIKRPGTGLGPDRLEEILGRRLRRDLGADSLIRPEDLE